MNTFGLQSCKSVLILTSVPTSLLSSRKASFNRRGSGSDVQADARKKKISECPHGIVPFDYAASACSAFACQLPLLIAPQPLNEAPAILRLYIQSINPPVFISCSATATSIQRASLCALRRRSTADVGLHVVPPDRSTCFPPRY